MPSALRLPRLIKIIEALQSARLQNSAELAELCGVSRRTVFRDLVLLQGAGLHVLYDDERQGYYLPQRLTLPPGELSVPEAVSLLLICQELGGNGKGIPFQQAAQSAAEKIYRQLPSRVRSSVSEIASQLEIRLDARNPLAESQGHYSQILAALVQRKQLRVVYESLALGKTIQTALSPYRILFSRRSWYVIGRSSIDRAVRTLNVGRIVSAELMTQSFVIPPRFSLERYLGNAWHLIRDRKHRAQVTIRFQPRVARNVAEVQWHKTQTTQFQPDGSLLFQVQVDGISEISWWILGYGDQAEVLEPPALRTLLSNRIAGMCRVYGVEPATKQITSSPK